MSTNLHFQIIYFDSNNLYNIVVEADKMYIDYEELFINRLIKLRKQKGISARSMSLSIGQNANYINQVEGKKTFPSMQSFFYICDYLDVSPEEFFDAGNKNPTLYEEFFEDIKKLDDNELYHIHEIIRSLVKRQD